MFATIRLVNISFLSENYHSVVGTVRTLKRCALSNFQMYNMVLLATVTMLYLRSPELIHLVTGSLYPLTKFFYFPYSQSLATTNLLCFSFPHISEITQHLSFLSDLFHFWLLNLATFFPTFTIFSWN